MPGLDRFMRTTVLWKRASVLMVIAAVWLGPASLQASLTNPTNSLEAGIRNAIVRGDAQELRVLLGQASELSASDTAIAQRALSSMEAVGASSARSLAGRYGIDWANKAHHALNSSKSGAVKEALLARYQTAVKAFARVDEAVAVLTGMAEGGFERAVLVDGMTVWVRGAVRDGFAFIGTIFKK